MNPLIRLLTPALLGCDVRCSYVLVFDGKIANLKQSPNTAAPLHPLHSSSFGAFLLCSSGGERGAPAAADTGLQQRRREAAPASSSSSSSGGGERGAPAASDNGFQQQRREAAPEVAAERGSPLALRRERSPARRAGGRPSTDARLRAPRGGPPVPGRELHGEARRRQAARGKGVHRRQDARGAGIRRREGVRAARVRRREAASSGGRLRPPRCKNRLGKIRSGVPVGDVYGIKRAEM
nr:uncharacterized protein LOC127346115 isoform X1 [Lolium perenne]